MELCELKDDLTPFLMANQIIDVNVVAKGHSRHDHH
jgi:hypothetical protein